MIASHEQYLQAVDAVRLLEEGMAALRQRLGPDRESLFAAMAQDYLDSITAIRGEIDAYTGLDRARAVGAPLWLSLEGAELSPTNIRTSLLAGWLERWRRSVSALAEYSITGRVSLRRHSQEISDACDFRLLGFSAGSLRIGLELQSPAQLGLFPGAESEPERGARAGLAQLLEGAAEAMELARGGRDLDRMREELTPHQSVLFKQVLRVTPGARERVRAIVLDGAAVPREAPVRLDSSIRPILASLFGSEAEPEGIEELEGTLREIDLDEKHFIIRSRPGDLPDLVIYFDERLISDAREALDRRVRVEAARGTGARPRFRALVIEALDEDSG